jgi:hypothetical protein
LKDGERHVQIRTLRRFLGGLLVPVLGFRKALKVHEDGAKVAPHLGIIGRKGRGSAQFTCSVFQSACGTERPSISAAELGPIWLQCHRPAKQLEGEVKTA